MRRSIYFQRISLLFGLLFLSCPDMGVAQCINWQSGPTSCARSNFYRGEILPSGGTSPITVSPYSPGEYFRMPVLAGGCYSVSTCGAPFDTHINCFTISDQTNAFAYDDDNGPLCGGLAASVTMVPNFTNYAHVDVRQYFCQPGGTSSITITVQQNNNLSITSSTASMCQGQTRLLSAVPAPVTGALPGSGSAGTFTGTGVSGALFTAPIPGASNQPYTLGYTFGYVSTTQAITVYHTPTTANAGADQTICATSATLQGNAVLFGAGQWTTSSSVVTITSPTSPTTSITGLTPGSTTVLRWTISNGPCTPSLDSVVITTTQLPTPANAGPDQSVCADSIFLAGNSPAVGLGSWSVITGTGIVQNLANPFSMFSNLTIGNNAVVWSISNGVCPTRRDTVYIQRDAQAPQPYAGPDKLICGSDATLSGNIPAVGSGLWNMVSGSGVIGTPGSPNSPLTAVNIGSTVLTWSITNGTCPPKYDTLVVTRNALPQAPTVTGNQTVCFGSSVTLTANTIAPNPTIIWWDSSAGGNAIAAGPTFTTPPLTGNITVFAEVTDGNTFCSSTRTQYNLTVVPLPTISLGPNQTFCSSDSVCLDAGPGMTSYQWNTGATSRVLCTNTSGTYWVEIVNANGCHAYDTITIIATQVPNSNLGPDFTLCTGNQNNIGIAIPATGSSYIWNTGATTGDLTVTTGGTYSLTVTDINGCSSSDVITITQANVPIAAFTIDDNLCPNVNFTDQSTDSDTWVWSFGTGATSGIQNPAFNYQSVGNGTYMVTLIASGQCGSDTLQQSVLIDCVVAVSLPDNLSITVFPNPNDGIFKIHFEGLDQLCELEIHNELGQMVYAKHIEACGGVCEEIIDIHHAAAGIYFATMKIGSASLTKRVIIR